MLKACTARVAVDSLCRLQAFTQSTGMLQLLSLLYSRLCQPFLQLLDANHIQMMRLYLETFCTSNNLHQKFYNRVNASIHLFRPHVSRIMGLTYA
jgi:hypothetical protein